MRFILALYCGVVLSDVITFTIGRMMRFGLLEPLRKKMKLGAIEGEDENKNVSFIDSRNEGSNNIRLMENENKRRKRK